MRAKTIWRAALLTVILALTPGPASAQFSLGYAPTDPIVPLPYGSTHPEEGIYTALEFLLLRQTNPLENQVVMTRGFFDINAQIPGQGANHIGSDTDALDTNQIRGPGSYQPAFKIYLGYKFNDESTLALSWLHIFQIRYQAVATAVPANFNVGSNALLVDRNGIAPPTFADSFISAPVYNFPSDFAGPPGLQNGPNNVRAYGVWDAASLAQISFVQREEAYDLIWRKPIVEEENYRFSSLVGPRFFWIWEKFAWRTTNFGFTGSDGPSALYTNIDSNRMYGWNIGCSQECYLGQGFACQLDTSFAPFLNIIKERAKYETGLKFSRAAENKRARTDYTFVPELEAKLSVMWYPTEYVQLNLGYNFMAFFNTVNAQRPVDFNYSSLDPKYDRVTRFFDGLSVAVVIVF
jgi:hypothetical protein